MLEYYSLHQRLGALDYPVEPGNDEEEGWEKFPSSFDRLRMRTV